MGDIADYYIDLAIEAQLEYDLWEENRRPLKPSEVTEIAESHFNATSQKTKDLNKGVIKW